MLFYICVLVEKFLYWLMMMVTGELDPPALVVLAFCMHPLSVELTLLFQICL